MVPDGQRYAHCFVLLASWQRFSIRAKGPGEVWEQGKRVMSVLVTGHDFPKEDLCPDYIV